MINFGLDEDDEQDELPAMPAKPNSIVSQLTVTVKDEESTLRTKHLLYDEYTISLSDPVIKQCIDQAVEAFKKEPDQVKIRINLDVQ